MIIKIITNTNLIKNKSMKKSKKMKFKFKKNGYTVGGSFSRTVNDVVYPTVEAQALIQEAMEMDKPKTYLCNFTEKTLDTITTKYGLLHDVMILQPAQKFILRITARKAAWLLYKMDATPQKNLSGGDEVRSVRY